VSTRVLIADDTAFYRAAIYGIVTKGGYEVVGKAANGAEAIRMTVALKPDIVILDIIMPVKNGIEVAKEISRMEDAPKIIMCSSLGFKSIIDDAVRAGASAYIVKPPSADELLKELERLRPAP
jgi:two-component system chemotaxis response regulator CheY